MSGTNWAMWLVTAATAFGLVAYLYRYRELPGRGRGVLVVLRGVTLALLLLLLFDPSLAGPAGIGDEDLVLLDASSSMNVRGTGATSVPWAEGLVRARATGARNVLLVGESPRLAPLSSLDAVVPADARSRLLPALQAAAQTGARRVTLITDGRLDDTDEVLRWLPRLRLALEIEDVGGSITNTAVTRAWAPAWVETGQPLDVLFEVMAVGAGPDSLVVRVLREGEEAGRTTVARPDEGRFATGVVRVVADSAALGNVRLEVALEAGDDAPADDVRHVYVEVSRQPAGVAILSMRPDWETRFLYPVLERSLGLPVRAFLRAGDRWIEQGPSARAGLSARDADVLDAVTRAELVVLHGVDATASSPAIDAAAAAPRLLLFPAGSGPMPGVPLSVPEAANGDWYLSGQLPTSPIAPALAGIEVGPVPPLTALRIADVAPGTWAAATASRGRRGPAWPLTLSGRDGERRWVVALGQGYWLWALRGGEARAAYERLWSALGGWLLEGSASALTPIVTPAARVIEAGSPVLWLVAGADSILVQVTDTADIAVLDTVLVAAGMDAASTGVLEPGRYHYAAHAIEDPAAGVTGEFTVESATTENIRMRALDALKAPLAESGNVSGRTDSRPLHASMWPYLALVGLLCAEWILRRRWGLR